MKDNEIIKALECCIEKGKCNDCPCYLPYGINCGYHKDKNALDLINRQKAEIERLQKAYERFADIGKMYSEIRDEVIKEFAERLKQSTYFMSDEEGFGCSVVFVDAIDNLVKEMTEGNENA